MATKAEKKNFLEANKETIKFVLRIALLAGGPQILAWATSYGGIWADLASVLLPIVDKWIHENDNIESKGLSPF